MRRENTRILDTSSYDGQLDPLHDIRREQAPRQFFPDIDDSMYILEVGGRHDVDF